MIDRILDLLKISAAVAVAFALLAIRDQMREDHLFAARVTAVESEVREMRGCMSTIGTIAVTNLTDAKDLWNDIKKNRVRTAKAKKGE